MKRKYKTPPHPPQFNITNLYERAEKLAREIRLKDAITSIRKQQQDLQAQGKILQQQEQQISKQLQILEDLYAQQKSVHIHGKRKIGENYA